MLRKKNQKPQNNQKEQLEQLRQDILKEVNSLINEVYADMPTPFNEAHLQARLDKIMGDITQKAEKAQVEIELSDLRGLLNTIRIPDVKPLYDELTQQRKDLEKSIGTINNDIDILFGKMPEPVNTDELKEYIAKSLEAFKNTLPTPRIGGGGSAIKAFRKHLIDGDMDYVTFDTTPEETPTEAGSLSWNADEETLDLILNSDVTLQLGQETVLLCKNQTGSDIADGVGVMFAGTLGASGRIKIAPAVMDGTYPSSYFIGVTTQSIANDEDGFVTVFGKVRGLDTSIWNEGDILYADPSNAGQLTATEPQAPNNHVTVAAVVNSHAQNGELFVRPTFEPKLESLQDVNGVAPEVTTSDNLLMQDVSDNNVFKTIPVSDVLALGGGPSVIKYYNTVVSETTSPTDLVNHTIPANTLGATGQCIIKVQGYVYNGSGSTTNATLFLIWGGNTIFFDTTTTFATDTLDMYGFEMSLVISNINDTGKQYIQGEITISNNADANQGRGDLTADDTKISCVWGGETLGDTPPDQFLYEDTTSDLDIQIQVDPSLNNAAYQWVAAITTVEYK